MKHVPTSYLQILALPSALRHPLLVHAESEQARSFYEHLIPEFERSPTDPLHLLLRLKDIRRMLDSLPG